MTSAEETVYPGRPLDIELKGMQSFTTCSIVDENSQQSCVEYMVTSVYAVSAFMMKKPQVIEM